MKLNFLILFFVSCVLKITAQDSISFNKKYIAKNNVSIELGGVGFLYSLNYERNFGVKDKSFHTLRIGISYGGNGLSGSDLVYLPINYTYVLGKKKSKFFIGFGLTFSICPNPYPSTFTERQYARHHITQIDSNYGQAYSYHYQPLLNTMLCPIVGYEFVSKKAFYFKVYTKGFFLRGDAVNYYTIPWGGFTFGIKLNRNK
jgi:hypothetical protein